MTVSDSMGAGRPASQWLAPIRLTWTLVARHWPHLLLIAALGSIARDLLLYAAVETGLHNALGGMALLSLVVLTKLVVVVLTLQRLEPDLPNVEALEGNPGKPLATPQGSASLSVAVVGFALLPFFAYYAAWGFLGDTVREYSRAALAKVPFGEKAQFLDVLQSRWLVAAIILCWVLRYAAKKINSAKPRAFWPFVIVALDATWIFIGIVAISAWQEELLRWIGSGDFLRGLPKFEGVQAGLSIAAWAAADNFVPRELEPATLWSQVQRLFFYALLPVIWFVMVAIIYGHDMAIKKAPGAPDRPHWRGWLSDFAAHFISSYRSRYLPVVRSVRMALNAGLPTICVLILGYRLIGYLGAWIWYFGLRLGRDLDPHQIGMIAEPISLLFGSLSDQNGGILLDPLRICLLAACFERAVAANRQVQG